VSAGAVFADHTPPPHVARPEEDRFAALHAGEALLFNDPSYGRWQEREHRVHVRVRRGPDRGRLPGRGLVAPQAVDRGQRLVNPGRHRLVALGIRLALRCDPCVFAHVEKAKQAGATREQILETAGVVVMMQGDPAYTCLPKLVDALEGE
jgi:AhpD family alkylhydroperoxidase